MPDEVPPTTEPTTPPAPATPPWGDGEFDADRAARLIEALRADKEAEKQRLAAIQAEREELAAKVQAFETAQLSEQERVAAELAAAKKQLAEAHRASAMAKYNLPESAAIFLTGESPEDIEAQASALASLAPQPVTPAPTPVPSTGVSPALPNGQVLPPNPADSIDPVAIARRVRGVLR